MIEQTVVVLYGAFSAGGDASVQEAGSERLNLDPRTMGIPTAACGVGVTANVAGKSTATSVPSRRMKPSRQKHRRKRDHPLGILVSASRAPRLQRGCSSGASFVAPSLSSGFCDSVALMKWSNDVVLIIGRMTSRCFAFTSAMVGFGIESRKRRESLSD